MTRASPALIAFISWTAAVLILAVSYLAGNMRERFRASRSGGGPPPTGPPLEGGARSRWERDGRRIPLTVALVIAAGVAAFGWGAAAVRLLGINATTSPLLAILSLLLGWGMLSHLLMILGFARRLKRSWVVLFWVVGAALAAGIVVSDGAGLSTLPVAVPWVAEVWIASIFIAAILGVAAVACFAPPRGFDTHAYHLELPRRYAATGAIPHVPYMAHSAWPQAGHLLLVPGFLFRCRHHAQVLSWLMGVQMLALVFESARTIHGIVAAIMSALLLAAVAEVVFQMAEASVDLTLGAFTIGALVCFALWIGSPGTGFLLLAGVFAGFAASVKLSALLLVAVLTAAAGIAGAVAAGPGGAAAAALTVAGTSALIASPWYVRSAWLTGNPFFHFATGVFRTRHWAPSSVDAHRTIAMADGWGPISGSSGWLRYALRELARSPGGWGPGLVGLVPAALLLETDAFTRTVGGLSVALVVATLIHTNQIRLMVGAAAGISILGGAVLAPPGSPGLDVPAWYRTVLVASIGIVGLLGAIDVSRHKLLAALDPGRTPSFLRRFLPYYDDFAWMNAHTAGDARILLWTTRGYLLERDYIWLPPWQQGVFDFRRLRAAGEFWRDLIERGVTHVYFTDYEIRREMFRYLHDIHEEMVRDGMLAEEKRFASGYKLYRVASVASKGGVA